MCTYYIRFLFLMGTLLISQYIYGAVIDRAWCRYQSNGFELISDLPQLSAHELIHNLERFRSFTSEILEASPSSGHRIKTVVFSRQKDFHKVFDMKPFVGFMRPSLVGNMLILGPGPRGDYLNTTAFHEYTHHLLRNRGQASYPSWYEEGFATYLASLEFSDQEIVLGANIINKTKNHRGFPQVHPSSITNHIRSIQELPVQEIFQLKSAEHLHSYHVGSFYEKSWLIVHMFKLGHLVGFPDRRQSLVKYLDKLNKGMTQEQAFREAFDVSYHTLDNDLKRYAAQLKLPTMRLRVSTKLQYEVQKIGCMNRADIAYELGIISAYKNPPYAHSLLTVAIAEKGPNADVHIGLSLVNRYLGNSEDALSHAQRAVNMDLKNVSAKIHLANLLLDSCSLSSDETCGEIWDESTKLFREALRLEPSRIDAVFGLGVTYLYSGDPSEAVGYLVVAYHRAPWAARINLYLGESYRLIGDTEKARTHLTSAVRWESVDGWRKLAEEALGLLKQNSFVD